MRTLKIISPKYLEDYKSQIDFNLKKQFDLIEYKTFRRDIFYYNTNSVASSARIEGEVATSEDLAKHIKGNKKFRKNYIAASDDLYQAYIFAQSHSLNENNLLKAHKLLSKSFLTNYYRGKVRNSDEVIRTDDGRIIYTATDKKLVKQEFKKLMSDINILLRRNLTIKEVFYYGFMISLVFVKIHPFEDGNGRTSRLLEKWFIAQKLGKKAWFLKSELNYYNRTKGYFLALNRMGLFYENTDYSKALRISLYTVKTLK